MKIFLLALATLAVYAPQLIHNRVTYSSWIANTYAISGATFEFSRPVIWSALFSNHGLFVWAPLTFLACIGYFLLLRAHRADRLFLLSLMLTFLLSLYLFSSVYAYGAPDFHGDNSFGARYFCSQTLFFAIGWAEILRRIWRWNKTVLAVCIVLVLWNLQLLMQQRYLGWLPYAGEVPYMQVFYNYKKFPDFVRHFVLKHGFGSPSVSP